MVRRHVFCVNIVLMCNLVEGVSGVRRDCHGNANETFTSGLSLLKE
jgi:hypothetical protein